MSSKKFSTSWKRSTQPRKQRKFSYNTPLHLQSKKMMVHLSPELRKKYGMRNVQVRRDDKVKVLRGKFSKKEVKVERVNLKRGKVYLIGIEAIKKDGTKRPFPLSPSNLMIVDLTLGDKKRKAKLESGSKKTAKESKIPQKKEIKKESNVQKEIKDNKTENKQ